MADRTDPAPLILSASSIRSYLSCGYRYYLGSVLRIGGAQNMPAAIGTAVHAAAEAVVRPSPLRPESVLERSLDHEVASVPGVTDDDRQKAVAGAHTLLGMYRRFIVPTLGRMRLAESSFLIRVEGILYSGQIDFGDQDVHDTKTTESLSRFHPEQHRMQLTGYRHGYRALLGEWPGRLMLDVLALNGHWKQVELEPDDRELADAVSIAASGILEARFDPTGATSGACKFCPFSGGVCRYAVVD